MYTYIMKVNSAHTFRTTGSHKDAREKSSPQTHRLVLFHYNFHVKNSTKNKNLDLKCIPKLSSSRRKRLVVRYGN